MRISLSIEAIRAQVLAQTALRSHMSDYYPPMLAEEHEEYLSRLARGAFGQVCLAIAPMLTDCEVGDDGEDLMQLEIDDCIAGNPVALRLLIEHAVAAKMLSQIYSGTDNDAGEIFESDYVETMSLLRRGVKMPYSPAAKIVMN